MDKLTPDKAAKLWLQSHASVNISESQVNKFFEECIEVNEWTEKEILSLTEEEIDFGLCLTSESIVIKQHTNQS